MTDSPLSSGPVPDELPNLSLLGLAVTRRHGNAADLTEFCRRCQEFFTLVADPAEPAAWAKEIVTGRPREVESARKLVLSIERNHEVIGIVDLLEGFPEDTGWYVGLFCAGGRLGTPSRRRALARCPEDGPVGHLMIDWSRSAWRRRLGDGTAN